jgi:limonene-1,2-epoxide hydrolase
METAAVAGVNCSIGPDEGCAVPEPTTDSGVGVGIGPEIWRGPLGHDATVCNERHNCGASPIAETSALMASVVVLSFKATRKRGESPDVDTGNDDKSTVREPAGIATLFHPLITRPVAVSTVRVAVLYVVADGAVSLRCRHERIEAELVQASRGNISGAENSAIGGGVTQVEPPVTASICVIAPESVLVQMQLGFWASIVAVYAELLTGQFAHAAPLPDDNDWSQQ